SLRTTRYRMVICISSDPIALFVSPRGIVVAQIAQRALMAGRALRMADLPAMADHVDVEGIDHLRLERGLELGVRFVGADFCADQLVERVAAGPQGQRPIGIDQALVHRAHLVAIDLRSGRSHLFFTAKPTLPGSGVISTLRAQMSDR